MQTNDENEHDEMRLKTFSVKKMEWRINFLDTAFQLLDRKAAERASFCGCGMPIRRMRRDDSISEGSYFQIYQAGRKPEVTPIYKLV